MHKIALIAQACSSGCGPPIDMFPILIVVALLAGWSHWGAILKKTVKEKVKMKNIKNIGIVAAAVIAAAAIVLAKQVGKTDSAKADAPSAAAAENAAVVAGGAAVVVPAAQENALPGLVDLGASKCIPCKAMKPILDDLKANYADQFTTEFIDVWEQPDRGHQYRIESIPTQIFFDAKGKELHRHVGFISKEDILGKWKELGIETEPPAPVSEPFSRWAPARPDTRSKDAVCYLCDGDIPTNGLVVVKTEKGDVRLCGLHHYFVVYTSLTEDKSGFEKKVSVADWATGLQVPIADATYVYGMEAKTGRPTIKSFADKEAAERERQASGGNVLDLAVLQGKELANACGFCDRAVYPEDAAQVVVGDVKTWGCCSHCALGVAARTGKDIEIRERDRLTGETIIVKTLDGGLASLEPATAVAWYGQRVKPDGSRASAGCFHQGFFVSAENLAKWAKANPFETGEQISIAKALADKMKLTPQQIGNACKIGECAPK